VQGNFFPTIDLDLALAPVGYPIIEFSAFADTSVGPATIKLSTTRRSG